MFFTQYSYMYTIYFCIGPDHFDECLTLISDHHLYKEALPLFTLGSDKYKVSVQYKVFLASATLYK